MQRLAPHTVAPSDSGAFRCSPQVFYSTLDGFGQVCSQAHCGRAQQPTRLAERCIQRLWASLPSESAHGWGVRCAALHVPTLSRSAAERLLGGGGTALSARAACRQCGPCLAVPLASPACQKSKHQLLLDAVVFGTGGPSRLHQRLPEGRCACTYAHHANVRHTAASAASCAASPALPRE